MAQIKNKKINKIIEKPKKFISNTAITGLYFFDKNFSNYSSKLKKSSRGELEITDLNKVYLQRGKLGVEVLGRGFAWLDTGTHESLLEASNFVQTIEHRQGLKVGCIEEIAYAKGYIGAEQLLEIASVAKGNAYCDYLRDLVERPRTLIR